MRTYDDKVYSTFRFLNVPEDDIECDSLLQSFLLILYLYMKASITCKCI